MADDTPTLRRSLSLPLVTFFGLGNILGAGIYVLVGKVAGEAGYQTPVAFMIASVIAALTAFTFAELSSRYPVSAGESVYVFEGFGKRQLSILVGLLIIMTGVVSASTIARGFVGYLDVFVELPHWLVIVTLLAILGLIAAWGIMESVRTAAAFTVLEVGGLLMLLYVSAPYFTQLPQRLTEFTPSFDLAVWPGIFTGTFLAFYAFVGFEDMVNVAEEVKNPQRNLPRGILIALFISSFLYIAIAFAVLLVLTPQQLAQSDAPLASVYQAITGAPPLAISLIAMFAVVNGALIQIIMASRVCYGMANQNWLPSFFSRVSSRTRTPVNATAVITCAVAIMALWLPIESLARATSFFLLIIFSLVNLSLWRIKLRKTNVADSVFEVPLWVPIAGFAAAIFLLLSEVISQLGNL
ncbi:MAG: amino acid permease [Gammaproteobacteria bacterium]|nr:amino acid permease [Gammaproteobacteria bacterium]